MKRPFWLLLLLFVPVVRAQTSDFLPGENLVTGSIPPIPAAVVESASRYAEFRTAMFLSWHPTGVEMLITTRFADVPQIHSVRFPGGARTQLTFYSEPVAAASYEPKRGTYFVFRKDIGGGEWYQSYRFDLATGVVTLLTDGKSRNTPGVWSTAGDRMAYGSTRRNGKDIDFYIVDPLHPSANRMLLQLDRGESWNVLAWSPNDSLILAHEEISVNESYLWLVDVASGAKRLLTPKERDVPVSYAGGRFRNDGKAVYTTTDRDGEALRLVSIDLATGRHTPLASRIDWDVTEFDVSRDGRTIAFVTNEDGVSILRLLPTATGTEELVPGLPIGVISGIQWHQDGVHLGFTFTSAQTGSDVYVLNAQTRRIERWTTSEANGLPVQAFAEPQLIHWKGHDGRKLSGFLYRPPSRFPGKHPVMVVIHGGPERQSRPTFLGRTNYYLEELGLVLIYPNVRGSTGYGKTFLKLDDGLHREDSYRDLSSLLDWIRTQEAMDPGRILVTGGSYGGHATLAVAAFSADKIRCAVDVVGMSNLVTFLEHTEAYRRDLRRVEYGDERDSTTRAFLERIAPLNNVNRMTKPLFVIAGKNDPRVPASESEQLVGALRKSGTPVWYLLANDEGHGFRKKRNIDYQFYATVLFVRTFLLK